MPTDAQTVLAALAGRFDAGHGVEVRARVRHATDRPSPIGFGAPPLPRSLLVPLDGAFRPHRGVVGVTAG